jgi:hypothetical protein
MTPVGCAAVERGADAGPGGTEKGCCGAADTELHCYYLVHACCGAGACGPLHVYGEHAVVAIVVPLWYIEFWELQQHLQLVVSGCDVCSTPLTKQHDMMHPQAAACR